MNAFFFIARSSVRAAEQCMNEIVPELRTTLTTTHEQCRKEQTLGRSIDPFEALNDCGNQSVPAKLTAAAVPVSANSAHVALVVALTVTRCRPRESAAVILWFSQPLALLG